MNWRRAVLISGALCLVVSGGAFVIEVMRKGDTAERQTISMTYLSFATTEFIHTKHDWPTSWEELAKVQPKVGMVEIPRDLDWVEKVVDVDFHARISDIARQQPDTFTGFKPRHESYYNYNSRYATVIDAAKEAEATAKPVASASGSPTSNHASVKPAAEGSPP